MSEPAADLDLAYEGQLRSTPPSMTLAQYRMRVLDILLDSVEHLACDYPPGSTWSVHRADTIHEQLGKARYELQELRAGR
jgi:hypothetical protein